MQSVTISSDPFLVLVAETATKRTDFATENTRVLLAPEPTGRLSFTSMADSPTISPPFQVLVIDDSKVILDRLIPLLEESTATGRVLPGGSYEEGESLLAQYDVDIAVIDINLPDKSGIDLLRFIKTDSGKATKPYVIMMTDEDAGTKRDLCLSLGADYFIDKFEGLDQIVFLISRLATGTMAS